MTFDGSPFDIYQTRHQLGRFIASCSFMTKEERLRCHDIFGRVTDCASIRGKLCKSIVQGIYYTVMKDARKCDVRLSTLKNIEAIILEHIAQDPLYLIQQYDSDDEVQRKDPFFATPEEYTPPDWANGDIFWDAEPLSDDDLHLSDSDDELLSDRQARLVDNMVLCDLAKTPGCSKCRYLPRGCKKCVKDFKSTENWKTRFPNRAAAVYIHKFVTDIIRRVIINNQCNL